MRATTRFPDACRSTTTTLRCDSALEQARDERPDLVLNDVKMPGSRRRSSRELIATVS